MPTYLGMTCYNNSLYSGSASKSTHHHVHTTHRHTRTTYDGLSTVTHPDSKYLGPQRRPWEMPNCFLAQNDLSSHAEDSWAVKHPTPPASLLPYAPTPDVNEPPPPTVWSQWMTPLRTPPSLTLHFTLAVTPALPAHPENTTLLFPALASVVTPQWRRHTYLHNLRNIFKLPN